MTVAPQYIAVPRQAAPRTLDHWRRELEALLREHEPARAHCAMEVLRAYQGMERELVQCYRHYYTGAGGFRVGGAAFSLPREAIDTYLRARRSVASKGDGMRDVEPAAPAATPAPRPRAASTSAMRTTPSPL